MSDEKFHSGLLAHKGIKPDILEEYGNNYFELWTYDLSVGQPIKLAGILKELPNISMTASWKDGPGKGMIDEIKKYMCSDTMEMIMAYGGQDRSWNSMDEQTDRTYDGTDYISFNLNIRCYTNEKTGSWQFSTWDTWLKILSLYATPSVANKVNIKNMVNNACSGIVNGITNVSDAFSQMTKAFGGQKDNGSSIIDSLASSLQTLGNTVSDQLASRDGINRVEGEANQESYYGSKLWKLRIYPGIYKAALPVYIDSWTVTFSKERYLISELTDDRNKLLSNFKSLPYYVDYQISCKMDQMPSCNTWFSTYLRNKAATKYKDPKD